MYGIDRNLPYAEEAQHMVYAVSIKKLRHVLETAHPPGTIVLQHLVPVVSGEPPVLTVYGEVIRRCTCLSVEIEVFRLHPHVAAVTVDTDGDIALQNNPFLLGIVMSLFHLRVEHILHEVVEGNLLIRLTSRRTESLTVILVPCIVIGPP